MLNVCSDFDLFIFKPLPEFRWGLDSAPTCLKIREPSDEDYWNGSQQYLIQFDKHYFRQFQIFSCRMKTLDGTTLRKFLLDCFLSSLLEVFLEAVGLFRRGTAAL